MPLIRFVPQIRTFIGEAQPELPDDVPSRLKEVRLRLGLTQEALAKAVGQDEGQISRWESGKQARHPAIQARLERELRRLVGAPEIDPPESFYQFSRWRRSLPRSSDGPGPATFGERLRWERLRRGVSAAELARRLRVSRAAVRRIEKGLSVPSMSKQKRLLAIVGRR